MPRNNNTTSKADAKVLTTCLEVSTDKFLEELMLHLSRNRVVASTSRATNITREGIYKALKKGARPGFSTIKNILEANGFKLTIEPMPKTVIINMPVCDNFNAREKTLELFILRCKAYELDFRVGCQGVRFTGTDEEIALGETLMKEFEIYGKQ